MRTYKGIEFLVGTSDQLIKNFKCDALRDLVSFVQFKKLEKHPSRSVTFSKVWVFSTFFELYKWYQIAQNITNNLKYFSYAFKFA